MVYLIGVEKGPRWFFMLLGNSNRDLIGCFREIGYKATYVCEMKSPTLGAMISDCNQKATL